MAVTNVIVSIGFVVGSWMFLHESLTMAGDVIFVIGSAITFLFAAYNVIEVRREESFQFAIADREKGSELLETLSFAVAGFVFMVGTFFYWPGIYQDEAAERYGEKWGATLFIVGSFGFILASFFNALNMAASKSDSKLTEIYITCHQFHVVALLCSQLGSVLFFTGSFLYRPELSSHCKEIKQIVTEGVCEINKMDADCASSFKVGTFMYIIGSVLYLVEAVLNFASATLRHRFSDEDDGETEEVEMAETSEPNPSARSPRLLVAQ